MLEANMGSLSFVRLEAIKLELFLRSCPWWKTSAFRNLVVAECTPIEMQDFNYLNRDNTFTFL